MARLFISHSSHDNAYALAFQGWLAANGWDRGDVFIDLHDIGAGELWRDTLRKANAACEAVILLASPQSLDSVECQEEIKLAELLGKPIITAVIRDLTMDDVRLVRFGDRQVVDLSAFPRDHVEALTWQGKEHRIGFSPMALVKIKARLSTLGVSPGSFPWPPRDRPNAEPYPGLNAFGEDDAGIFFGRDADIMAALTEIRLVRRRRAPRLIVIDAASGAGKSSFLRAGLWPRLRRDPDFAPLAILRPSQGLITGPDGLGRRIAPFFERHQRPRAAGGIHAPLMAPDEARAAQAFAELLTEAVELATDVRRVGNPDASPPAPIIAIDQAEEMLAAGRSGESDRFLALLAAFLKEPPVGIDPYVLLTIRADSVQELLDRVAALGLETPKPLYLPPLLPAAYREVILRPAEVYSARVRRLEIEPMLADALVRDATGADALPLLAFTLARLFGDFAAEGRLTRDGYVAVGGTAGSISRALGEATVAAGAVGSLVHQRRLLVPALVTWDPEAADGKGAAKRLPAHEGTLLAGPRADLAPLAKALVDVRLLRRDRETLEVAHEALLRVPPISDWLEEDREFLIWRDRTAKARAAYEANARGLLVGLELDIARTWLKARGHAAEIDAAEHAFIEASIAADDLQRSEEARRERALQTAQLEAALAREQAAEAEVLRAHEREAEAKEREAAVRRVVHLTRVGLVAAILLALVASAAGSIAYWQWGEAARNAAKAEDEGRQAVAHQKEAEAQRKEAEIERKKTGAHRAELKAILMLIPQTARSKFVIASFYANQVPPDYEKAYKWYEEAATDGNPEAMRALGLLHANGHGVPQDYTKADEWFEMATIGDAPAMAEIGKLYADGGSMPPDDDKAREWFERAAAAGDKGALGNLSWHALFLRKFPQALDAAERALKADPELLWIQSYRAYALMFLDKRAEAWKVYLEHKDKQIPQGDNRTWQQVIAADFVELRAAGLRHPQMPEIEAALGIDRQ